MLHAQCGEDHKPDLRSERARIERAGGNVHEVLGLDPQKACLWCELVEARQWEWRG